LHRAYHALPKVFTNSAGQPTGAVYGFASMLLKVIEDLKPDFMAVAFDERGPTFRHVEYVDYKKGRPEMDSELVTQVPLVRQLLTELQVPFFSLQGFEGDDIIASLNRQAARLAPHLSESPRDSKRVGHLIEPSGSDMAGGRGEKHSHLKTFIVTGDMDMLQLVDQDTFVYAPKKGISEIITYDPQVVKETQGLNPSQITDYKGLRGDASDRIPGVRGIGEKTALALLQEFNSLEEIYQNLGKVEPKVAKKLAEDAEAAALSKKLATVVPDVPITLELDKCRFRARDKVKMAEVLRSFGFKSLAKRLVPEENFTKGVPSAEQMRFV
ncbi:MAG: 5'-3' exonuclease H3TH domain-containing protein, partial [bacterium]|nr:5'-3' exonuclease H3TH domain-containing protein [bacterium]